jgi:hypothetical protein
MITGTACNPSTGEAKQEDYHFESSLLFGLLLLTKTYDGKF